MMLFALLLLLVGASSKVKAPPPLDEQFAAAYAHGAQLRGEGRDAEALLAFRSAAAISDRLLAVDDDDGRDTKANARAATARLMVGMMYSASSPVERLQNTFPQRNHRVAQLQPGCSLLPGAP